MLFRTHTRNRDSCSSSCSYDQSPSASWLLYSAISSLAASGYSVILDSIFTTGNSAHRARFRPRGNRQPRPARSMWPRFPWPNPERSRKISGDPLRNASRYPPRYSTQWIDWTATIPNIAEMDYATEAITLPQKLQILCSFNKR